ncbi:MAG: pyrroline-5-carboxylate reductase family protein [Prolixibacteraceae bacterium]
MKTNSLGFIGGGRITKIFLKAFANRKRDFKSIVVYDSNSEVSAALKTMFPEIEIATSIHQAARQSIVFLALHPPVIIESLDKMAENINADSVVISLAPKISIEKIASKLKTVNIARMIPNATSYINEGFNPMAFAPGFDSYERIDLLALFMHLGKTFEVKENTLEAYALISAMLPTYFWFQWKELVKLGSQMGLSPDESKMAITSTLEASINLMFKSELTTADVMDLIPLKPIGENEEQITKIYESKLMGLFEKIKP